MDSNGQNQVTIAANGHASSLAWSLDSKRIAFTLGGMQPVLATMNTDGSNTAPVLQRAWDLAWSPNADVLAFSWGSIYLIRPDGSNVVRLTSAGGGASDSQPSWAYAPPVVTTGAASEVTSSTAVLNGRLNELGSASSVTIAFEWGTTHSYGFAATAQNIGSAIDFTVALSNLLPNTTYYFRAIAVSDGSYFGAEKSFKTSAAPSVKKKK